MLHFSSFTHYSLLQHHSYIKPHFMSCHTLVYALLYLSPTEDVNGWRVPVRVAAWVELVVIRLLAPDSSFEGHLAGIVAGLLYVGAASARGYVAGLLNSKLFSEGASAGAAATGTGYGWGGGRARGRTYGSGVVGQ